MQPEMIKKTIEMINNPDSWLSWPYLPMKKKEGHLIGVMLEEYANQIFLGNMWKPDSLSINNSIKFDTTYELIEKGWEND